MPPVTWWREGFREEPRRIQEGKGVAVLNRLAGRAWQEYLRYFKISSALLGKPVKKIPKSDDQNVLEIWNPWGKVLERSGLRIEHFCWEVV